MKTLQASGNEHWAALLRSAGERGLMLNGMEDAEIQKNLAMVIVSNASPHQVVARLLANKLADSTWKAGARRVVWGSQSILTPATSCHSGRAGQGHW